MLRDLLIAILHHAVELTHIDMAEDLDNATLDEATWEVVEGWSAQTNSMTRSGWGDKAAAVAAVGWRGRRRIGERRSNAWGGRSNKACVGSGGACPHG